MTGPEGAGRLGAEPRRVRGWIALLLAALAPAGLLAQAPAIFSAGPAGFVEDVAWTDWTVRRRAVALDFARLEQVRTALAMSPEGVSAHTGASRTGPSVAEGAVDVAEAPLLQFDLFHDESVTVAVESAATTFSGGYSLVGRPLGQPFGQMVLVVNGRTVAGTIRVAGEPSRVYEISSVGEEGYMVSEVRETPFECSVAEHDHELHERHESLGGRPFEAGPADRVMAAAEPPTRPFVSSPSTASGSVIDIVVFYTTQVKTELKSDLAAVTKIEAMVATANKSFTDSGVDATLNLVGARQVMYTESNIVTDADRFWKSSDGHMDDIHDIRVELGADVYALVRGGCCSGRARVPLTASTANAPNAVMLSSARDSIFVHELGHVLGLQHDRYEACSGGSCPATIAADAFGYVNQEMFKVTTPPPNDPTQWQTIMAYFDQCGSSGRTNCHSIFRFSDPSATWKGDPLGVLLTESNKNSSGLDGPSNAVRVIGLTRGSVAEYAPGRAVEVSFGATTATATEGGTAASLSVSLDAAPGRVLSIPLKVESSNAWSGDRDVPETVSFGTTDTTKTITVIATDDDADDDGETIRVSFGDLPNGVAEGSTVAVTVTLVDDDGSSGAPDLDAIRFVSTPADGAAYRSGRRWRRPSCSARRSS